ncbi:YceI family protein [uncultured Porphyromonas sp.]|uniref:YceI family protein n=1 Tax=uncultured Porphyromonas sp. TaxID=159274 RepID=UPI0026291A89|nr:YceI family protein [uncultured Porphyromonas sp.]
MKYQTIALAGIFALGLSLASCSGSSKGEGSVAASEAAAVSDVAAESLAVDSTASALSWKGFKPGGEHYGKLPISAGQLDIKDDVLHGGYVTIKMNGIIVEDLKAEEGGDKLKAHLEGEDFFDVAKYPEAKFELTNVPAEGLKIADIKELKGNLTLKDVTKNITIPVASIQRDAATGKYSFTSQTFRINRADWNVKYGSKSFFTGLGDKFINDEIELSFVLQTL